MIIIRPQNKKRKTNPTVNKTNELKRPGRPRPTSGGHWAAQETITIHGPHTAGVLDLTVRPGYWSPDFFWWSSFRIDLIYTWCCYFTSVSSKIHTLYISWHSTGKAHEHKDLVGYGPFHAFPRVHRNPIRNLAAYTFYFTPWFTC